MSKGTKRHREHAGAKNSFASAGFWGKREEAKAVSKKSRRRADKEEVKTKSWAEVKAKRISPELQARLDQEIQASLEAVTEAMSFFHWGVPESEPGDYAEEDENGVVWLFRADGHPFMFMPRSTWDALRGAAKKT